MDFDLGDLLAAAACGKLGTKRLNWSPEASVCVVMASGGYPGKYAIGKEIVGLENVAMLPNVSVFHAGTRLEGNIYYTSSGRVLSVTAAGRTLDAARRIAYDAVHRLGFLECHYRSDIALAGCRVANVGED
jgi:phosphoribosylamine---glycine ligase